MNTLPKELEDIIMEMKRDYTEKEIEEIILNINYEKDYTGITIWSNTEDYLSYSATPYENISIRDRIFLSLTNVEFIECWRASGEDEEFYEELIEMLDDFILFLKEEYAIDYNKHMDFIQKLFRINTEQYT